MSAGIMTRLAFSMPPFTPRATMMNVTAANSSMKATETGPLATNVMKFVPPSASCAAMPAAYANT